jgi:hypothetical protein
VGEAEAWPASNAFAEVVHNVVKDVILLGGMYVVQVSLAAE